MDEMMGNDTYSRDRHFRQQLAEALKESPLERESDVGEAMNAHAERLAEVEALKLAGPSSKTLDSEKERQARDFDQQARAHITGALDVPAVHMVHHHHEVTIRIYPDPGPAPISRIIRMIEEELRKRPPGQGGLKR